MTDEQDKSASGFRVPPRQPISAREDEVSKFWQDNKIFEKSIEQRSFDNRYVFIDGPPFVSGSPHYAHLLVSIAKDLIPRFWTMKGKRVRRVFGWDCHGLPIEAKVNEKYKLHSRRDVEKFGVDRYVQTCREYVESQISDWRWYINKIGRWVDLDHAYRTMDADFGESVIWAFKQLHDKGLIYKGKRVSLYSTDTSTPVSDFEVAMDPDNYQDVEDLSAFVKFELRENIFSEQTAAAPVSLIAWTTTPWTLPSNFALAVNPAFTYALVKSADAFYVVAEDRLAETFKDAPYEIVTKVPGAKLEGLSYVPLFDYFDTQKTPNDFKVYLFDGVTNTEGTGVLHVAPAFGEVDFELGKKFGLSALPDIDAEGRMTVGPWQGVYIRKASPQVVRELSERGLLWREEKYTHRLPFYRGKNPLIYMAQDAYFVSLKDVNPRILELNQDVKWVPETFKDKRFREVVETAPDWGISRQRYWGTVMPVWRSESGDEIVAGSAADLAKHSDQVTAKEVDGQVKYFVDGKPLTWHRDVLDKVVLKKDGVEYRRIPEILDVWLDSGSVPFAEYHYPFANRELFEQGFPADFIIEYTGQIRAWFQILYRVSTALFDQAPFRNVIVHGVLAGTDGRKMSKSFKNYPDSKHVLETFGADALRLYFMASPLMLGESASFSELELQNKARALGVFWNSAVYFFTYAEQFEFDPKDAKLEHPLDRWIMARLNETVAAVEDNLQAYVVPPAARAVEEFINDLSTWYIRRSRPRIVSGDRAALAVLYQVLLTASQAFAPIIPFITETIYQEMKRGGREEYKESVHLEDFPVADRQQAAGEKELLVTMAAARAVVSESLSLRAAARIKVRQPLAELVVQGGSLPAEITAIIRDEVNVKEVKFAEQLPEASDAYAVSPTESKIKVALKVEIPAELQEEGYARDIIRFGQTLRRQAGYALEDHITLIASTADADLKAALTNKEGMIAETLKADRIVSQAEHEDASGEFKINGKALHLGVFK